MHREYTTTELRERAELAAIILANTEAILANLEKIEQHDLDVEELAAQAGTLLGTLEEIEGHDGVTEEDAEQASAYLATLQEIERAK